MLSRVTRNQVLVLVVVLAESRFFFSPRHLQQFQFTWFLSLSSRSPLSHFLVPEVGSLPSGLSTASKRLFFLHSSLSKRASTLTQTTDVSKLKLPSFSLSTSKFVIDYNSDPSVLSLIWDASRLPVEADSYYSGARAPL